MKFIDRTFKAAIGFILMATFLGFTALFTMGISSCSTAMPTQQLSSEMLYKRDMIITVNGVTREGMITMPMLDSNVIHITAAGALDTFAMQNCAGEWVKPKAWNVKTTVKSGLFGWGTKTIDVKNEAEFTYTPSGLERLGACPLQMRGFNIGGKDSWGFVDFKTDTFALKGTLVCNAESREFDGVEVCQSRTGLYQQLKFKEVVFMSPDAGCALDKTEGTEFTFPMPQGQCVYRIKGRVSGALGKLTLFGYNGLLIRE